MKSDKQHGMLKCVICLLSISGLLEYYKILLNDKVHIAEVYFFVLLARGGNKNMVALVSLYSMPHRELLRLSSNTLYSCEYKGNNALCFIDVKTIQAVVAMVPHTPAIGHQELSERFFLVEKPGFDIAVMNGYKDELEGKPKGAVSRNDNTTT